MRLKIAGGRVYDPAQDCWGEVRDLYLDGDRLVSFLPEVDGVLDARHQLVLPGGIDLRGQVATYGLNFLRLWGELPSPSRLAELYVNLGYTLVHEPFLTLTTARYVHRQLAALPLVDTSTSLVVNLRDLDLWLKDRSRWAEVVDTLQYFLEQTKALNFRIREPWVRHRQEVYAHRNLTLAATLECLAWLAEKLRLPLILEASPEVLRATLPEPRAFHLAALGPALRDEELLEAALCHLEQGSTGDFGLIRPRAPTRVNGTPVQVDLGLSEPLNLACQFPQETARRALKLALAYNGPGGAFSGAGAFWAPVEKYGDLWTWLGDRESRRQFWGEDLEPREISFREWLWATRTLPARLLGLSDRGHLGPGARADLALFDLPEGDWETKWPKFMGNCRTLLKGGKMIKKDFQMVQTEVVKVTCYRPTGAEMTPLAAEVCQFLSLRPENFRASGDWEGLSWQRVGDR